ncbi:hypothetical protein QTO34_012449 [Cnephaeus nilssonii]|uniref:Uncharacterized protein n=1 Tax=Cnephaeus nilssonii TaxID=3371016 RepID=A0AA40HB37_CNENI|nr:hypothetical protein QTO34_012449 [Eptesicus nilssonii]
MSQCAVLGPCGQLCQECLIDSVNKEFDFRLLCTGSSSPLPLNMSACAKLGHLWAAEGSLLAVVLRRPETRRGESLRSLPAPRPLASLTSSRSFQTSTISGDMDTAARVLGAGTVFGSLITVMPGTLL